MNEEAFEKTNWNWQFHLFQQRVGEWVDYQFSNFQQDLPKLPDWSISPEVWNLLKILFWVILGAFIIWVIWRLWQELSPYIETWLARLNNSQTSANKINYHQQSLKVLIKKAEEFYQQSNYKEACRYLYLAMLQQLHDKAIILQQPSRTDGEYLELLTSTINPIQAYETLITTHEQLCFSDHQIRVDNYQQCQQAYQDLFNA
ncbi:MAG: DUF4129 domain-containing protein [Sphaerospermopsis sp. SIO1G2]|nr:DUF4129 domain-containing protein [Sphaerospermopsis sp. SIO1G1]NET73609.1 DUF4129 domain-containing protein [Sphaerospermopsis sp. SIO1G2]